VENFLLSKSEPRGRGVASVFLLGDFEMSAALSADAGGEQASPRENIGRALALLQEALDLVDAIGVPSEIGARLQEVIDALDEHRKPSANHQS
jgi:hypothetical protein